MRAVSLSSLWYFPVLFIAGIIVQMIIQIIEKPLYKAGCVLCLFVLGFIAPHLEFGDPFGVDIALVAAGFVLLGNMIQSQVNKKYIFLFPICLIALITGIYLNQPGLGYVLMANAEYGNPIFFLLGAVGGAGIIIICARWGERIAHKRVLLQIGQNTLGIFVIHKPVVQCFVGICNKFSINCNNIIVAIIISLTSIMITFGVTQIIQKIMPSAVGIMEEKVCKV